MQALATKIVLVTGASRGIGAAIARQLAAAGASTTSFPAPGMAVYGGSKTPGSYLMDVLAKELGSRGITANSIVPYATAGAGIFTAGHSSEDYLIAANPWVG